MKNIFTILITWLFVYGNTFAAIQENTPFKGYLNECKELLGKARSKQLSLDELKKYRDTMSLATKTSAAFLHAPKVEEKANDCLFTDAPPVFDTALSADFIKGHSAECVNRVNLFGCQVELHGETLTQIRNLNNEQVVNQNSRINRKPAVVIEAPEEATGSGLQR
jgi:hypothetical protein